jgi:hypothetical protein
MVAPLSRIRSDRRIHLTDAMRAHPLDSDPDRMPAEKTADGEARRYEIRVRGSIGPTMMQAFPTLAVTRSGQDTLLTGSLPDQSALYGAIYQLEALGLQLLEIRRLHSGGAGTTGQIA